MHRYISARTQHQSRLLCFWVGEEGWGSDAKGQRGMVLGNFKLILNHTKIETQTVTFWEKDEREGKMKGKER